MSNAALKELYAEYPDVIESMPDRFDSHQFILKLVQKCQPEYIEALYVYRNRRYRRKPAPFMIVHGLLAKHLTTQKNLIERVMPDKDSIDIFGIPIAPRAGASFLDTDVTHNQWNV